MLQLKTPCHLRMISRYALRIGLPIVFALFALQVRSQLSVAALSTTYTIDFDNTVSGVNNGTFAASGFDPSPDAGDLDADAWDPDGFDDDGSTAFGDDHSSGDFARGNSAGGVSTSGVYAFTGGSIGAGRALGVQPTGSDFTPGAITLRIQNNTGSVVTKLTLAYEIHCRNNADGGGTPHDRANSLNFAYSSDNSSYTDVSALDFTSPGAEDALGFQQTNRSTTLSGLNMANGAFFYLRWIGDDESGSNNRDEFALDDIQVSGETVSSLPMCVTGSYAQNFNTLASSGTSNTWGDDQNIASWFWQQQTGSVATYSASTGSLSTPDQYSFGTAAADRAMGSITSAGSPSPQTDDMAYGVLLRNTSGLTITNITVAYTGEQWRKGADGTETLTFHYQTSGTGIASLTPGNNSGWTAVTALNFTSPITGGSDDVTLDGNAAANRTVKSATALPSLSLTNNQYIMLRWDDGNLSGNDHGMSIDDVTVSWTVTPTIATPAPTALSGFSATAGQASTPQTFTISALALGAPLQIAMAVAGQYELRENGVGSYGSSVSFTPDACGVVGTKTIQVRLMANNSVGNSITGTVNCTSTLATTRTVTLSGQRLDCTGGFNAALVPGGSCNDGNACTIGDAYNSSCVCAGTFQDTDGDGTCNANDGCPNDPNKIAAGQCGCGVADTDSDSDGTSDCNDGCPSDPNKIAPGVCGCGVADTDSDGDGTANCIDGCPSDPNKIAPGVCGCGVADTDSDGDGTANCIDGCPSDPNKIAPGVCGCGVADTDSDSDGTADCNDGCPSDPNKIAAGQCGCGVADTDTDGDLTADCNDGCPSDPNKIAPGVCGCGVADVDSDGDLTLDCNDGCPNDPSKTAPGVCGCGVADTDSDSDGTADCNDGCPNDPDKTSAGQCGCGVADTDSDSDGTADCNDGCPNDPDKTSAGQCGCGVADTDSDSDGTADCNDGCPADADKVDPGQCGCGVADTDTDGDLTADCLDDCPLDPLKTDPGNCGCGVVDTDSDGDITPDCMDLCPNDPFKTEPGSCGCGVLDDDTDGDGSADCVDLCPLDPNKLAPGSCGCGSLDPGSACDDGIAETSDDVIQGDCTCHGEMLDCAGDPGGSALPGTPCDDGDGGTVNDTWDIDCQCVGTAGGCVQNDVRLDLTTDNNGDETSWEVVPQGGSTPLCSGPVTPYGDNMLITESCCLANGCYELRVLDSFGDGMCCTNGVGGYVLHMANGDRIIDNAADGSFASVSQIVNNLGFCLPIGTDRLTPSRCDLNNLPPGDWLQAVVNESVSAQYGVNNANSGYQFWLFNPDGGYSRRIFISHDYNNYWFPAGPARASYLKLSSIVTNPVPVDVLLNVRVRSQVAGTYNVFGPACRLRLGCQTTQLVDDISSPQHSCGITNVPLNGSKYIYAVPVSGATNYKWNLTKPGYTRNIASTGSGLLMTIWATNPLQYGFTYNVKVRVSFDGGVNYCPQGASCTITTAPGPSFGGGSLNIASTEEGQDLQMWPNPVRNEPLHLVIDELPTTTTTAVVDLFDLFGKQVMTVTVPTEGGTLNTILELNADLAKGSYTVRVSAGELVFTERLVVE